MFPVALAYGGFWKETRNYCSSAKLCYIKGQRKDLPTVFGFTPLLERRRDEFVCSPTRKLTLTERMFNSKGKNIAGKFYF